jgi:putative DNA primase/helicase
MTFEQFAEAHGLVMGQLVEGRWIRVPTADKPRSRNGAYKFMGDVGFVQNWATMTEPATWRAESEPSAAMRRRISNTAVQAAKEVAQNAARAAHKAAAILGECELAPHPYLASKGFPDELVNVWKRESDNVMVVPMRAGPALVGCQLIKPDGDKNFLFGQRSGGAQFIFNGKGQHFLCEGYATVLSARQALQNLKVSYSLHVCFSAGNMKKVAEGLPAGFVLADNDASGTGERVAREIGWPYWISDTVGEDANDYAQRAGVFSLAMQLKRLLIDGRRRRA